MNCRDLRREDIKKIVSINGKFYQEIAVYCLVVVKALCEISVTSEVSTMSNVVRFHTFSCPG